MRCGERKKACRCAWGLGSGSATWWRRGASVLPETHSVSPVFSSSVFSCAITSAAFRTSSSPYNSIHSASRAIAADSTHSSSIERIALRLSAARASCARWNDFRDVREASKRYSRGGTGRLSWDISTSHLVRKELHCNISEGESAGQVAKKDGSIAAEDGRRAGAGSTHVCGFYRAHDSWLPSVSTETRIGTRTGVNCGQQATNCGNWR